MKNRSVMFYLTATRIAFNEKDIRKNGGLKILNNDLLIFLNVQPIIFQWNDYNNWLYYLKNYIIIIFCCFKYN